MSEKIEWMPSLQFHSNENVTLNFEADLRKWCLERAFERRDLMKCHHMEVTNVAEEYYLWITQGVSQSNRQRYGVSEHHTSEATQEAVEPAVSEKAVG